MVPSRLICSYFCYGILFKNVVLTVLISVCPHYAGTSSRWVWSDGKPHLTFLTPPPPVVCRIRSRSFRRLRRGCAEGWGSRTARCPRAACQGGGAAGRQSSSPTSFRQPSLSPSTLLADGGEGQVEWESAAAEDPISDKLTKRSRRPQIGSVVLVRMSEEGGVGGEGDGSGGEVSAFRSICFF